MLDRTSPLPLWAQVQADLRKRLGAGAFAARFPTELELVEQYAVSRHTVREALRRPRDSGVLDSARGRGTWIAQDPIEQSLGSLYSEWGCARCPTACSLAGLPVGAVHELDAIDVFPPGKVAGV